MALVRFQNGPDAPEIVLSEEIDAGSGVKAKLVELAAKYGTVPEAEAWLDGASRPKDLAESTPELTAEELHAERNPSAEPPDTDAESDAPASKPHGRGRTST